MTEFPLCSLCEECGMRCCEDVANAPQITTTSLASATVGQTNYSQTLQGTGGTSPYTWSLSAGILPKGLTLNSSTGVISGPVSSSAVTETFSVTLTSANGTSTTKQFTITVCGAPQITTDWFPSRRSFKATSPCASRNHSLSSMPFLHVLSLSDCDGQIE
jgi:hypothetical protein